MSIATYDDLQESIKAWLNAPEMDQAIPSFIALAEAQMQREIRHHKMMQRAEADINTRYFILPTDWLETARFHVTGDRPTRLELTSMDDMLQLRELNSNAGGRPTHYTHAGNQLELFPTPNASYNVELLYFQKIPPLGANTSTNWLLTSHPDVYLYGALMQASPFLEADQRLQIWAGLYRGAVDAINTESKKARYSGAGMRVRINSY